MSYKFGLFKIKYVDLSAYKDIYFKKHIFLEEI